MKKWRINNLDTARKYDRQYKKRNPDLYRNSTLKGKYGITLEKYEEMLEAQDGVCVICEQPEKAVDNRTGLLRNLAVDHCHDTGEIRGLLCSCCNRAIGYFRHNSNIALRAALYLEQHQGENSCNGI